MKTELQSFTKDEFGTIRTETINNDPWFIGKDVAEILGYTNTAKAIRDHVDDEDKLTERFVLSGQNREVVFINESGLYSLILSSKMPNAKKFKRWVTSEVLPSIRKTGQYQLDDISPEMQAILMHDKKIVKMERRMDRLEFDIPLYGCEAEELSRHVKRKGVAILGGKNSDAYSDKSISQKVYADIYNQIKREYGLYSEDGKAKSYKALKRKYLNEVHELIDRYQAPTYIREMISEANAQLSFTS